MPATFRERSARGSFRLATADQKLISRPAVNGPRRGTKRVPGLLMGEVSGSFCQWPTDQQASPSLCSLPCYCPSDLRSRKEAVAELGRVLAAARVQVRLGRAEVKAEWALQLVRAAPRSAVEPRLERSAAEPRLEQSAVVRRLEPLAVVLLAQLPVASWAARQRAAARPPAIQPSVG
jgi:hypothetical protein